MIDFEYYKNKSIMLNLGPHNDILLTISDAPDYSMNHSGRDR